MDFGLGVFYRKRRFRAVDWITVLFAPLQRKRYRFVERRRDKKGREVELPGIAAPRREGIKPDLVKVILAPQDQFNVMENDILIECLPFGLSFVMILVEGGRFLMGQRNPDPHNWEKPAHEVQLSTFYIGQYPVTQALWKAVLGAPDTPSLFFGDDRPVENLSWDDVTKIFLPALNRMTEATRPSGKTYRLPTEAEWEYAARGGKHDEPGLYAGSMDIDAVCWYEENSDQETKPAGLKGPNALGLYDMSGNVYERCSDWFDENYYQECIEKGLVTDPKGPAKPVNYQLRAARGGAYYHDASRCRVCYRGSAPIRAVPGSGFRLVLA